MKLILPLSETEIKNLKAGDSVLLSGTVLTARDSAHKKIFALLDSGAPLPFEIKNSVIYYAGPCPAKDGMASGSCGPTTSARMESFAPRLLDSGLNAIIGKGEMSDKVRQALIKNRAVYFAAIGGAGALYANCIKKQSMYCIPELLSEAVYKLEIENFPVIVAYDCYGNSVYD